MSKHFVTLRVHQNVRPDDTWEMAMRAIINDSRYRALATLSERKKAFQEYAERRRVEERVSDSPLEFFTAALQMMKLVAPDLENLSSRC